MRSKGFDGMVCSMAEVMGAIGDRWGTLIMRDMLLGLSRFDDLRRSTGVTNATLSDRLKHLEREGLIRRRKYQDRPVRFEYEPTQKGRDLAMVMQAMLQVGDKWRRDRRREAPMQLVDQDSGRRLKLSLVDCETGSVAANPRLQIIPGPDADEVMHWRIATGESELVRRDS